MTLNSLEIKRSQRRYIRCLAGEEKMDSSELFTGTITHGLGMISEELPPLSLSLLSLVRRERCTELVHNRAS